MKKRNPVLLALVILLVVAIYFFKKRGSFIREDNKDFDRNAGSIIYTKHALCRMGCRKIDEDEVREILKEGRINYGKSEPNDKPDPKYALEGVTRDGQEVRIIFAPSSKGMVVITVIDLKQEWQCDCN